MFGKCRFLNANALKLIAAASMLIDHMGLMFFPEVILFRALGRLAMPLFAEVLEIAYSLLS